MTRVGIIGHGRSGAHHCERLQLRNDCRIVAVGACDRTVGAWIAESGAELYDDARRLLRDERVELVVVAEPPVMRSRLVVEALQRGKHVLVDGPLALTLTDADNIATTVRETGRILSVFQPRRTNPDFRAALAALADRRIGSLLDARLIAWDYAVPSASRQGNDASHADENDPIESPGAHYFDQLLRLTDLQPVRVFARRFHQTDDDRHGFSAFVDFESGLTAQIEVATRSCVPLRTGWALRTANGGYHNHTTYSLQPDGEIVDAPVTPDPTVDPYADVFAMIRANAANATGVAEAQRTVALIEAARRSVELETPVAVPAPCLNEQQLPS